MPAIVLLVAAALPWPADAPAGAAAVLAERLGGWFFFSGGRTLLWSAAGRRWRDLDPLSPPPPVAGASLAYDPVNDQIILFGGGHVAERASDGRVVGHTGLWIYNPKGNVWRPWPVLQLPPPRMDAAMAADPARRVLVLFGGDAQSHYLGDTWLFDLETLTWRASSAPGPEPRAGHFAAFDPAAGKILVGGGHNRCDLSDLWAYDAAADRWERLGGDVPPGRYLESEVTSDHQLLLRSPAGARTIPIPGKTAPRPAADEPADVPALESPQAPAAVRFANRWVSLPGSVAARDPAAAVLDTARRWILYFGGGRSDVDRYDLDSQRWLAAVAPPERPPRDEEPAGVTLHGAPWVLDRAAAAFEPARQALVAVVPIHLPAGYRPEPLRLYPASLITWIYDPVTGVWDWTGPSPPGLGAMLGTPDTSVLGAADTLYRLDPARREWAPLAPPPSGWQPPDLLIYDPVRRRVLSFAWSQVWGFDPAARRFEFRGVPPVAARTAVYVPQQDVVLVGGETALWAYRPGSNTWVRADLEPPAPAPTALLYDSASDLVLSVAASGGRAAVAAARYRHVRREQGDAK